MTAVLNEFDKAYNPEIGKCAICDTSHLAYPYLAWRALCICGPCCLEIKRGLTADIVHVAAIMELRALGYRDDTLERTTYESLRGRMRRENEELERKSDEARKQYIDNQKGEKADD
jgi:hypothetical protein